MEEIIKEYKETYKEINGKYPESLTYSRGWFTLNGGNFGLNNKLRVNELKNMIANLKKRIRERDDPNYKITFGNIVTDGTQIGIVHRVNRENGRFHIKGDSHEKVMTQWEVVKLPNVNKETIVEMVQIIMNLQQSIKNSVENGLGSDKDYEESLKFIEKLKIK